MKQVEMWKWFKLPVDLQRIVSDDKVDTVSVLKHSVLTTHHVEKMEIAINSYDANQALITKQAEQIKMLIELVDSANEKLRSVRDALYGQNLSISGWHLNGQLEPVDNWFDSNDWYPIECIKTDKDSV